MPTNVPPQYREAEERFRQANTIQARIAALQEMLAIMPKHKGTDHLKAQLRSRLSKLMAELEKGSSKGAGGGRTEPFSMPKEGRRARDAHRAYQRRQVAAAQQVHRRQKPRRGLRPQHPRAGSGDAQLRRRPRPAGGHAPHLQPVHAGAAVRAAAKHRRVRGGSRPLYGRRGAGGRDFLGARRLEFPDAKQRRSAAGGRKPVAVQTRRHRGEQSGHSPARSTSTKRSKTVSARASP